MSKKRLQVIYIGTVQGVGFRWTAERAATSLNLAGWVKNLPDGTVEVMAEGEEDNLNRFVDRINSMMGHYIRGVKLNWMPFAGEFRDFNIAYY